MTLGAAPVPPLSANLLVVLLVQVGVLLAAALLLGRLARRVGLPAVVGELTAGVLIGPSILAHVSPALYGWLLPRQAAQMNLLDAVAQIGVLLLVGITGMSIDLGALRRRRASTLRVSGGGLFLPLASGIALGFALPAGLVAEGTDRAVFAGFVGVAMCVSAIPVVAKTLLDMNLLHRDVGQLIVGAAAVDDIVGWLLLSVVSAAATTGAAVGAVSWSVATLILALAGAWVIGRPLTDRLLRATDRSPEPGVTIAAIIVVLVLAAAGAQALHLEAIVGCFVGGLVLGSTGRLDRVKLAPLRTVVLGALAPLFFATAGLRMDLTALGRPEILGAGLGVLAVAILGKFLGVYAGARASRIGHWEALALGAGLNSRGVIEVVVAMTGLRIGVLTTEMYTIVVLVAIATSLMAPPLLRFAVGRMPGVSAQERERGHALRLVEPADPPEDHRRAA